MDIKQPKTKRNIFKEFSEDISGECNICIAQIKSSQKIGKLHVNENRANAINNIN